MDHSKYYHSSVEEIVFNCSKSLSSYQKRSRLILAILYLWYLALFVLAIFLDKPFLLFIVLPLSIVLSRTSFLGIPLISSLSAFYELENILNEDIDPAKYLEVLLNLEAINTVAFLKPLIYLEQCNAYYNLGDYLQAHQRLRLVFHKHPTNMIWAEVYYRFAAIGLATGNEEEYRIYCDRLTAFSQHRSVNSKTRKALDKMFLMLDIFKKQPLDWTPQDLTYFTTTIEENKTRLSVINSYLNLAEYAVAWRQTEDARACLAHVLPYEKAGFIYKKAQTLLAELNEKIAGPV